MMLTLSQISAQIDAVLAQEARLPHSSYGLAIAIGASAKPDFLAQSLTVRGREFALRWCESQLALRAALCECELLDASGQGLVLLTPPELKELADDVAARLARRRILRPDGWHMVQLLFGAKEADARLARFSWLPQLLLDAAIHKSYPPVANGFLDLDTAWREFFKRYLQMEGARPDATEQLRWSMQPNADTLLQDLPDKAREACLQWLEQAAGKLGKLIKGCVQAGYTGDALALGLVCGVLYAKEGEHINELVHAQIRLERFVNEKRVEVGEGRAWYDCAQNLLQQSNYANLRPALTRADQLLRELRVEQYAYLSQVSPLGFEQRMRQFATAIGHFLQEPTPASLKLLELASEQVLQHQQARAQETRAQRVSMAQRLARWLLQNHEAGTAAADLTALLCWQADEGAFVDWARFRLLGVDVSHEVSQAYSALRARVMQERHGRAQAFASALPAWNAQAAPALGRTSRLLPLEEVIARVLAPLAANHPVLLLVLDGLSTSIFRELFARPELLGYRELVPSHLQQAYVGVAAFPTITEVSRASLLCGKLSNGAQSVEKNGFAKHPLLPSSTSKTGQSYTPQLFHKADLSVDGNLAPALREALANPKHKALALVYNAVDDHLSGPDQLQQRWQLDDLQLLLPILSEARACNRLVLVCADHGHLLDDQTSEVQSAQEGGGDRWHPSSGIAANAQAHALVLRGGRVRLPQSLQAGASAGKNAPEITCLWSEAARFGGKKKGYHGGVSLQEVAVPLALLAPLNVRVAEWQEALPPQPEWWDQTLHFADKPTPAALAAAARPAKGNRKRPADNTLQPDMFGEQAAFSAAPALPTTEAITSPSWIDMILQSSMYASQKALAARVAPPDAQMHKLLTVMDERGGKIAKAALAQRLALPEIRLNGMLSGARRILNVDQAQVLVVDELAATVEIKRALLMQQFRLDKEVGKTVSKAGSKT